MIRRRFIVGGVAGGTALVAGLASAPGPLLAGRDTIIAAIAPVMLAGALPNSPAERQAALHEIVRGVGTAVESLPVDTQRALAQLFELLGFSFTRRFLARVWHPWPAAGRHEIDGFLNAWRLGASMQLRGAYDALHQLVLASWYGNAASWARIGYPGPPKLGTR